MTMMFRWVEGGSSHNHDHGVPNLMIMTVMVRWVEATESRRRLAEGREEQLKLRLAVSDKE